MSVYCLHERNSVLCLESILRWAHACLLSLNDTFSITRKNMVKMVKSYSLYDLILTWSEACRMFFCHFWWRWLWFVIFFCLGWVFFNYAVWLKHSKEKWSCTSVTLGAHWKQAGSCRQTKPAVPAFSLSRMGRLQTSLCLKAAKLCAGNISLS